jgi:N-acetylglucosaminyldiphosphoundecaprenol N-acetyl-beta-D-mannosaminyltransferase
MATRSRKRGNGWLDGATAREAELVGSLAVIPAERYDAADQERDEIDGDDRHDDPGQVHVVLGRSRSDSASATVAGRRGVIQRTKVHESIVQLGSDRSGVLPSGDPRSRARQSPAPAVEEGDRLAVGSPTRYGVIGTPIAAVTFEDALRLLVDAPSDGRRIHVHFCTVHSLVEAFDDPVLRGVFAAPDSLALPDGVPVAWVGRAQGHDVHRVCGPDVMPALLDRSRASGARHYFYGGAPGVAERLAERMKAAYPGLIVVGNHSPPFRARSAEEDAADAAMINAASPDYVWVGLGAPKQDLWAARQRPFLDAAVVLAVGAAFDFHSGGLRRAPAWMQRNGLEWLYRLAAEPRRLARRYLVTNTRFLILLVRTRIGASRPANVGPSSRDGRPSVPSDPPPGSSPGSSAG